MFSRPPKVVVVDYKNALQKTVDIFTFSEEYPGVDIISVQDMSSGRVYRYAFTDLPSLQRVDLQDAYWQKLAKWLLASPSPSYKFPSMLLILGALAIGFAIGVMI